MKPDSLLKIKATRNQVGIIRTSKVDKGLEIKWSEITSIHDVFDMNEPHITFTNSLCNLKTDPLAQIMSSFAMKNGGIAFRFICASTIFGKTFTSTPNNLVMHFY